MLKVGLTGGIGSGKTMVSRIFEALGIAVYNSDMRAKLLMNTDPELQSALQNCFGSDIYDNDGNLNRPKLAEIIFNDPESLEKVNNCVHPAVFHDFNHWCALQNSPYIIEESAIIFERNIAHQFGKVILVTAPEYVRIKRVCIRDGITPEAVQERMANQWTDDKKKPLADYIINNDNLRSLTPQIMEIHKQLMFIIHNGF